MRELLSIKKAKLREITAYKYINLNTCFITGAVN